MIVNFWLARARVNWLARARVNSSLVRSAVNRPTVVT